MCVASCVSQSVSIMPQVEVPEVGQILPVTTIGYKIRT